MAVEEIQNFFHRHRNFCSRRQEKIQFVTILEAATTNGERKQAVISFVTNISPD